jgi:DNA-binding NtrC family response regulator
MLTGGLGVRTAVQAIKAGADDFLNKPFDLSELQRVVQTLLESGAAAAQGRTKGSGDFGALVGKSSAMAGVFAMVEQVAGRDTTVLITGESGTGKELVARELHERSARKHAPFVALNCAAFPESLIESELFGQEFYRVGRSKPIRVNVRVVTATNRNLEELVRAKAFRQDLFYRINVINIPLPSLRDRGEDIMHLAEHFNRALQNRYGGRALSFSEDVKNRFLGYGWPGNVRELENVVESLMALCPSDTVELPHLPARFLGHSTAGAGDPVAALASGLAYEDAERLFETEIIVRALKRANFVQTRAAELLGISRRMLKYKMDKLSISEKGELLRPGPKHEN